MVLMIPTIKKRKNEWFIPLPPLFQTSPSSIPYSIALHTNKSSKLILYLETSFAVLVDYLQHYR